MVLQPKQTTIAYRCPHCGAGVMSAVGLFQLSSHMVKLKCSCGESEMTVVYQKDGTVRFTVPCIFCPNPHHFSLNSSVFFNKELFCFSCPYADVSLAMVGELNHVKAELARSELELAELAEKSGGFHSLHGEEEVFHDPQVLEIVTFVLRELDEEGKIHCRCPEGQEGDYEVEICDDHIHVHCKQCGASKDLPSDSVIAANQFLYADSLELE
ncbi:MAG: hypothetical protein IJY42_06310 [Clostridia bacterium]|nr:hypothetical protein [Clostridia bacterium]